MTTILLARHGETEWNRTRRWQGHADEPLNELGREQARGLARLLAGERIDAIYSSDLARARETAEIVAAARDLVVTELAALREVDVGSWSGLTDEHAAATHPQGYERWRAGGHGWEGGESYEEMSERVVAALREIAASHDGGQVLVVTHGGSIRGALALAHGVSYAEYRRRARVVGNCAVARIHVENGAFRSID